MVLELSPAVTNVMNATICSRQLYFPALVYCQVCEQSEKEANKLHVCIIQWF